MIHGNASEYVICKMGPISSWPQCIDIREITFHIYVGQLYCMRPLSTESFFLIRYLAYSLSGTT